jgi:hypothetical protein
MQINNRHLKKIIIINTINKLTVLFLFDDFYSVIVIFLVFVFSIAS